MEKYDELGLNIDLLKARFENAEESVKIAEGELAGASDDQKEIWENRLAQRKEALEQAKVELANAESGELSEV